MKHKPLIKGVAMECNLDCRYCEYFIDCDYVSWLSDEIDRVYEELRGEHY